MPASLHPNEFVVHCDNCGARYRLFELPEWVLNADRDSMTSPCTACGADAPVEPLGRDAS